MAFIYLQLIAPHTVKFGQYLLQLIARSWDRKLSCNTSVTREIIQSQYESIYIGPEFYIE